MNLRDDDTPGLTLALPEEDDRFPSLQQRLERVARERDVLAVLRELARHGLREGDQVLNLRTAISGRLQVDCNATDPTPVVDTDLGWCRVASLSEWQRCTTA